MADPALILGLLGNETAIAISVVRVVETTAMALRNYVIVHASGILPTRLLLLHRYIRHR
jgi:hypothetical protein